MTVSAGTPTDLVAKAYQRTKSNVDAMKAKGGGPLTLAEKVLIGHLDDAEAAFDRGVTYNDLRPDRVAMQDATAQMALLQFMTAQRRRAFDRALRPPDPSERRRESRPPSRRVRQPRGVRLLGIGLR